MATTLLLMGSRMTKVVSDSYTCVSYKHQFRFSVDCLELVVSQTTLNLNFKLANYYFLYYLSLTFFLLACLALVVFFHFFHFQICFIKFVHDVLFFFFQLISSVHISRRIQTGQSAFVMKNKSMSWPMARTMLEKRGFTSRYILIFLVLATFKFNYNIYSLGCFHVDVWEVTQ